MRAGLRFQVETPSALGPCRAMPQGAAIRSMSAGIARRYDLTNRILSFGMEGLWRRRLVRLVKERSLRDVADLATGSGVIAFALKAALPRAHVSGYDFCQPMLDVAEAKQAALPESERIPSAIGDCPGAPCPTPRWTRSPSATACATSRTARRACASCAACCAPEAAFILEFTQPAWWMRPYYLYLKTFLPLVAWATTGDRKAYEYLAGSIASYPTRRHLRRTARRRILPRARPRPHR